MDFSDDENLERFEENKDSEPIYVEGDPTPISDPENEPIPQVVKPKRVVRNPQPKLNEDRLKGPRGIASLESYFERVKFKGRGYEEQDLNVLLKTYEYWCHRLYPKFPFDSCIKKIETLGNKKILRTHIAKIRNGMIEEEAALAHNSDSDEEPPEPTPAPFDELASAPALRMTKEQEDQIRKNMERAQNLRREKLKKIREAAEATLGESSRLDSQISLFSQNESLPSTSGLPPITQNNLEDKENLSD